MKNTLFLNPPSFNGFDGAAGARYPARREVTSYWYPTWLAQPAAMVHWSKLLAGKYEPRENKAEGLALLQALQLIFSSKNSLKARVELGES